MRIPSEVLPLYPIAGKTESMRPDAVVEPSRAAPALSEQTARKRVARQGEVPGRSEDEAREPPKERQNRGQPGEAGQPYERRKGKQAVLIDTRQGSLIDTKA